MESQNLSFERRQSHEILLGQQIQDQIVGRLARMGFTKRCVVLTDENVAKFYLEPLQAELRGRGFSILPIILPSGEDSKTLDAANRLYGQLLSGQIDRTCPLIALGGGVIGDLGGFVAATWMRGIPFINIPTTLLAMVDASIGGKTAVNLPAGKNMIGTFYQPSLVGIDVETLKTLPLSQLAYGLVEAIKHGAIADSAYFKFISKSREEIKARVPSLLQRLVRRSVHIKKSFVENDEQDQGKRAFLNYGHTFGHALEVLGSYRRFHHGEAVGVGMLLALAASRHLGKLREDYTEPLAELLLDFNLPVKLPKDWGPDEMVQAMTVDKKKASEKINLLLPLSLGEIEISPTPLAELRSIFERILPPFQD